MFYTYLWHSICTDVCALMARARDTHTHTHTIYIRQFLLVFYVCSIRFRISYTMYTHHIRFRIHGLSVSKRSQFGIRMIDEERQMETTETEASLSLWPSSHWLKLANIVYERVVYEPYKWFLPSVCAWQECDAIWIGCRKLLSSSSDGKHTYPNRAHLYRPNFANQLRWRENENNDNIIMIMITS